MSAFETAVAAVLKVGSCVATLRVMQRAMRDGRLGTKHRAVLSVLAEHVNAERGIAWPSRATVGAALGYTEKTIANALYALRAMGYVEWNARFEYVLKCPSYGATDELPQPQGKGSECPSGGAESAPATGQQMPQDQGKSLPQTRVRDSEPTKGTYSESDSAEGLFGRSARNGPGAYDLGKSGLLIVGVRSFGEQKGQPFETPIPRSTLTLCAKAHPRLKPDEVHEYALAVGDDWVARGDPGHRSGKPPSDKFIADFAAKVRAFDEAGKPPAAKLPVSSSFVDAEGWDSRWGAKPT